MMTYRVISRVAVIAAVVSVGSDCFASEMVNKGVEAAGGKLGTVMGIMAATSVPNDADYDAAKAAVETSGVLLDQVLAGKPDTAALTVNLAANFLARKGIRCLNANGVKVPSPEVGGFAGSHVVSPVCTVLKTAAPQLIASLAVMGARHAGVIK
jgi:hypothetical protein